jgi:molybdopterin-guanine dinucleotide biosynthesis protein A
VTRSPSAAVVLAGGRASRMGGGDKTLLPVAGRPMLRSIITALDVTHIAISANGDPARFGDFGLPVLPDGPFAGEGPLAGVLAALDWAASLRVTAVLTVPGDTPLLPSGLAERLAPAPGCASSAGRVHHLVALWPISCRSRLRSLLSNPGSRQVAAFAENIGMRYVDFSVLSPDRFANINTPDELTEIRAVADRLISDTDRK